MMAACLLMNPRISYMLRRDEPGQDDGHVHTMPMDVEEG